MVRRNDGDEIWQTWDCSDKDCKCVSGTGIDHCDNLYMTISAEGVTRDRPPISGCSYGNTITYGRKDTHWIGAREILIIGTTSGKGNCYGFMFA